MISQFLILHWLTQRAKKFDRKLLGTVGPDGFLIGQRNECREILNKIKEISSPAHALNKMFKAKAEPFSKAYLLSKIRQADGCLYAGNRSGAIKHLKEVLARVDE